MTNKKDCPFCNFEDAEVLVYQDELSYAIVPLHPINPYHTLETRTETPILPKPSFS